jgi:hypothetical protein
MPLQEFVATLQLAIEIYDELIGRNQALPSAEELTSSIKCYAEAIAELEKINPGLAQVKSSDANLFDVLGDWRASNSASAIVVEIEGEIQRLGDALYSSDEDHQVKRILEDVLAQSDDVRLSLEGGAPVGPEVFALAVDGRFRTILQGNERAVLSSLPPSSAKPEYPNEFGRRRGLLAEG